MDIEHIREHCLSKKGTTESFPFDEVTENKDVDYQDMFGGSFQDSIQLDHVDVLLTPQQKRAMALMRQDSSSSSSSSTSSSGSSSSSSNEDHRSSNETSSYEEDRHNDHQPPQLQASARGRNKERSGGMVSRDAMDKMSSVRRIAQQRLRHQKNARAILGN